ncbi:unnamed protein product [Moneuplotes crassus]|uniref:Alpha-2-macroglobulin domain-containing protein n=1 Tax=Euplotes crassus TaxID=5936 RepID=A0AAD1X4Q3_EUPCR|nr:unnamed protein product [Moneuplotes crassus]
MSTSSKHQRKPFLLVKTDLDILYLKIPDTWYESSFFVSFTLRIGEQVSTKMDILTITQQDTVLIEFTVQGGPFVFRTCQKVYFEAFSDDSRSEHVDIMNANIYKVPKDGENEKVVVSLVSSKYHGRGDFELFAEQDTVYYLNYRGVHHMLDPDKFNQNFKYQSSKQSRRLKNSCKLCARQCCILRYQLPKCCTKPNCRSHSVNIKKNVLLHTQKVSVNKSELKIRVPVSKLGLPNGGVISVNIYEPQHPAENSVLLENFPYLIVAEALAFVVPSQTLQVKVQTDKELYSTGDEVNYTVTVYNSTTGEQVSDDVYIDLSVTDLTPFLEIESKRQPPSLVSSVYLQKEVNITKEYEFLNTNEILGEAKEKLELLIGTQKWRLFKLDPRIQFDLDQGHDQILDYDLSNLYLSKIRSSNIFTGYERVREGDIGEAMGTLGIEEIGNYGDWVDAECYLPDSDIRCDESGLWGGIEKYYDGEEEMEGEYVEGDEVEERDEEENEENEENIEKEKKGRGRKVYGGGCRPRGCKSCFKQTQVFKEFVRVKNGQFKGTFRLGELVSKFRFEANSVTKDGVYGHHQSYLNVFNEFHIQVNIPMYFTNFDEIKVPVVIHNSKAIDLKVDLSVSTFPKTTSLEYSLSKNKISVLNHSQKTVIVTFKAKSVSDEYFQVKINAKAGKQASDSFTSTTKIIARGFPKIESQSGFLGSTNDGFASESELSFKLPITYESGSLQLETKLYINKLGNILDSLESLIRNPHGCFEQTSSTTYPLVMALKVLESLPEKDSRATQMILEIKQKLRPGYQRLVSFETETGGYEWFCDSPGHEALTAYALMQFNDMKQVFSEVDTEMVDRTSKWILNKRNGSGSFVSRQGGADSFAYPPPNLSDAYIWYALTSIGTDIDLDREINSTIIRAKTHKDSYLYALMANILYNIGRTEEARKFSTLLKQNQNKTTGIMNQKKSSITRSTGKSLNIETTALAILAWLKDESSDFIDQIDLAIKFIIENGIDGSYGSTQGTILSLQVLVEYMKSSKLGATGTYELFVDGQNIQSLYLNKDTKVSTLDFNEALSNYIQHNLTLFSSNSYHTIKLLLKDYSESMKKLKFLYFIQEKFNDLAPLSNPKSVLNFSIKSSTNSQETEIGDFTTYQVRLENMDRDNGQGMAVVIVRVPSCQQVDYNSLERLQNQNKVSYFEVSNGNSDIILYWRTLQPGEVSFAVTQIYLAETCITRPSKAYLYYDEDESQVWTQ